MQNGILIPSQFRSISVVFCLCDIETCCFPCSHKELVNASFVAEGGLQLLQKVADGSRYESTSICKAA